MTQLRLNPDAVSWREIDGEILALGHARSVYLSTSGSGALLWKSLVDGASREELIELIVRRFEVDGERAAADTDAFIDALGAQGLLVS
jgi:Coenzyme PQQ synthesis protein D (PqqD)